MTVDAKKGAVAGALGLLLILVIVPGTLAMAADLSTWLKGALGDLFGSGGA